jgi:hypothetical protein
MTGITDEDREVGRALIEAYYRGEQWPSQPLYERTLTSGERLTAYMGKTVPDSLRLLLARRDWVAEVIVTIEALEQVADIGSIVARARHGTQPGG